MLKSRKLETHSAPGLEYVPGVLEQPFSFFFEEIELKKEGSNQLQGKLKDNPQLMNLNLPKLTEALNTLD